MYVTTDEYLNLPLETGRLLIRPPNSLLMAPKVADDATIATASDSTYLYNPFHPPASKDDGDTNYPYAQFKVSHHVKI
jgi:hypothetical protein